MQHVFRLLSRLVLLASCVAWLSGGALRAADDIRPSTDRPWHVRSYATSAGLAEQRIFDVAFAPDGTAWFACTNGLWSYDGYRWKRYGMEEGLPDRLVRSVVFDKAGDLWVATNKGAGVYDPATKKWDTRGTELHLPNDNVRAINRLDDGSLWFCCDQWPVATTKPGGLVRYVDGTWDRYTRDNGLPLDYVIGVFRSSKGETYAFTPRGVVKQLGSQWLSPVFTGDDVDTVIVGMAETAAGELFAQGENRLVLLNNSKADFISEESTLVLRCSDGRIVSLRREPLRNTVSFEVWDGSRFERGSDAIPVSPQARFYKLVEAPDGALWCVGQGVILRWSHQEPWTHYNKLPALLAVDRKGNPWFSGNGTVYWHDGAGFHLLPGLSQLLGIDRDDTLLGKDSRGKLVTTSVATGGRTLPLDSPLVSVTHLQPDREGSLWLAGRDSAGKTTFAVRDGLKVTTVTNPKFAGRRVYGLQTPDHGEGVTAVLFSSQTVGFDWVRVTKSGIETIDLGDTPPPIPYPSVLNLASSTIMAGYASVFERREGSALWEPIGELSGNTFNGLVDIPTQDVLFTFQNDQRGRSGVALRHAGKWSFLFGNFEAPGLDLKTRKPYVISHSKLYRQARQSTLDFDVLALPEDAYITRAGLDSEGVTWLNTTSGVFSHVPERSAPLVKVSAPTTDLVANTPVRVSVEAYARFETAAAKSGFQFSYRVDTDAWTSFSPLSDFSLSTQGLKPGKHRLEVLARSTDGIISPTPATLDFVVQAEPLQYRTWFPYLILVILGVIGFLTWLGISRARALVRSHRALNREYSIRVEAEQALARALNELKAAHSELELRVEARTAELSEANEALRRALKEREESERSRTALEHQLREAQKMEAIGTLAGGIAHDFNNILTVIIPCTGIALDDAKHIPSIRDNLKQVLQAAERAKKLVQQILAFSRRQKPEQKPVDLKVLVRETFQLLRSAIPSAIAVNLRLSQDAPLVMADSNQLHQVLMNLCTNARHAVPLQGGVITITLDTLYLADSEVRLSSDLASGQYVRISIEDNGKGIPSDILPRIFEPFFTTKAPGEGTGLGLSVAHGIVKDHHGAIRVFSREGVGTRFDVILPPATASEVASGNLVAAPSAGHGEHILIVDDEFMVSRIMSQVLTRMGYRPSVHTKPETALVEFQKQPTKYQLLLTDLTMPGMNGLELSRALRAIRPELPIILMTGYGGDVPPGVESKEVDLVIFKPFEANAIVLEIEKLLGRNKSKGERKTQIPGTKNFPIS